MMPAGTLLALLALLAPDASAFTATPEHSPGHRPVPGAITPVRTTFACATAAAGTLPIQLALRHYIKKATPRPMRFLIAAGTDSALSETGAKVLQEFGPMYYYGGNDAARKQVLERLDLVGPFPALLIVKRASPKPSANAEIVRLGGHYLTGEHDGKQSESNEYTLVCGAGGWVVKGVKTESAA